MHLIISCKQHVTTTPRASPPGWDLFMNVQAKRPQYLKEGDVVEARIQSADGAIDLGVQRNRVVIER